MFFLPCITLRRRIRSIWAVAVIALATCIPSHAAHSGNEAIGDWKFTSVLDGVDITSIDEKQARRLLGKIMKIRREEIEFNGEKCEAEGFESKLVEPNLYVQREARISATKLRLPNPVAVVELGCTRIFLEPPNRAVIFWDGFFFGAARTNYPKSVHH